MNVLNELIDGMIQEFKYPCNADTPCVISNVLAYVDCSKYDSLCDGECDGSCRDRIVRALKDLKVEVNNEVHDSTATVENYHKDVLDELKGLEEAFWSGINTCDICDELEKLGCNFDCDSIECGDCHRELSKHIEKCIALEKLKQLFENKQEIKEKMKESAEMLREETKNKTDKEIDDVNHPTHYNLHKYECIDEMEAVFGVEAVKHFCMCNAWKYRYRAGAKNGEEKAKDLAKADWYIEKILELT